MGGDVQDEAGDDPAESPTAIALIRNVVPSRRLDLAQLGWISGKRALTRSNFPANFEYVDLRGFSLADLDQALDEEGAAYAVLEAAAFDQMSVDEVDRQRAEIVARSDARLWRYFSGRCDIGPRLRAGDKLQRADARSQPASTPRTNDGLLCTSRSRPSTSCRRRAGGLPDRQQRCEGRNLRRRRPQDAAFCAGDTRFHPQRALSFGSGIFAAESARSRGASLHGMRSAARSSPNHI